MGDSTLIIFSKTAGCQKHLGLKSHQLEDCWLSPKPLVKRMEFMMNPTLQWLPTSQLQMRNLLKMNTFTKMLQKRKMTRKMKNNNVKSQELERKTRPAHIQRATEDYITPSSHEKNKNN